MNKPINGKKNQNTDHSIVLSEQKAELRLIIDNIPSLVAYVDSSRKYRLTNKAYQNFFGINESEAIGKHIREVVGLEIYKTLKKYIDIVLAGKKSGYEESFKDKNGKCHILSANIIPYIDSKGLQNGFLVIVDDVTEERKLQSKIEELNRSLEKKVIDRTQQLQERTAELQNSLNEIKILKGILPLCSFCKKIRDDKGYWEQVEIYIEKFSEADITHSICPGCMKKHYPDEYAEMNRQINE